MSNDTDGFFAVNKKKFEKALSLSMNAAISYLVIACGTGKSNSNSSWSVHAVEKYTGISRGRAKKAINTLIDHRVIKRLKGGTKPRYQILDGRGSKKLDPKATYWLPNGIVMGVSEEITALERIRQTQNTMLLTLFLDLYSEQNLLEDGGISQAVYRTIYEKEKINERAQYNVYGFSKKETHLTWGIEAVDKHRRNQEDLTDKEIDAGYNGTIDFFYRIEMLHSLGLIEFTSHLVDHEEDGEILHELNDELESEARIASEVLLSEHHDTDYEFIIPLDRHLEEATVVTTCRTIYTPRTSLTNGWYKKSTKRNTLYLNKYNEIIDKYRDSLR
jgi:hypothetical protein